MKTLISGSMAFDSIMVFEDHFKNHILPEQIHILNVSFFVPTMKRHNGGCAGNIAYTLKLLGGNPLIMATVGEDFTPYQFWLDKNDISSEHVTVVKDTFTAQAFITTDLANNQINAFHPGAMSQAHINKVSDTLGVQIGIVAPNGPEAMVQHAEQLVEADIPFIFDPGQAMPLFDGPALVRFMEQARWLIVNDYESEMLMDKTGLDIDAIARMVETLIVTKGAQGSIVYTDGERFEVPAATISKAVDPTGCGDAYRAGVLYGLSKNFDWERIAKIGGLCGAIKVETEGTQSHHFNLEEFSQRYLETYGQPMDVLQIRQNQSALPSLNTIHLE